MKQLFSIIYSAVVLPVLILGFHLISIFKSDIRKALKGRRKYNTNIKHGLKKITHPGKIILIHTASMGEFEHIKPLISALAFENEVSVVVTFFSPSGYENVKEFTGVELFLYQPFDFKFVWKKVYNLLKPRALIISKHDVWPNQVWTAKDLNIPTFLVNASLPEKSSRVNPIARTFLKYVYRSLEAIYTISEDDAKVFQKSFPRCKVGYMGDTKFDQVLLRKKQSQSVNLLDKNWLTEKQLILFGSIWPEDAKIVLPAVDKILKERTDIKIVLVPHQPDRGFVEDINSQLPGHACHLFSDSKDLKDENIMIVDRVGVLADLYKYSDIAYVGGSFKQGIHNVMEPAVYGIPVIYGPIHKNSFDAIKLIEAGGGFEIRTSEQVLGLLRKFTGNSTNRKKAGKLAEVFAEKHVGATERLIKTWRENNLL